MRATLLHIRRRRSGPPAIRTATVDAGEIRIGRGTDNDIVLPGLTIALHHAEIQERTGRIYVEALGTGEVRVNRRALGGARRLKAGDVLQIGPHELRVVAPEAGEDLRLEVEAASEAAAGHEDLERRAAVATGLRGLSRRRASWLLVLGIPLVFLALPLATGVLESSWSSGPISRPHSFFAEDCRRCHEVGFQRVADNACLGCHPRVGHHAAEDVRPAELTETRCATCHAEHKGLAGLATLEERLCSNCHATLQARFPGARAADAGDFIAQHPQFQLALVSDPKVGPVETEWSPERRENSGLLFDHLRHVGQVVRQPDRAEGRYLQCGECHVPDANGGRMRPIEFERDCQACHRLGYDELDPDRDAPHGDPVEMRRVIREFYQGLALRGTEASGGPPAVLRRGAPGRTLTRAQQAEREAALAWAEARAVQADRHLMQDPGPCLNCHRLADAPAADGGADLEPVHVVDRWLAQSEFHHRSHEPFACARCHPAAAVFAPDPEAALPRPEWSLPGEGQRYTLQTPDELLATHGFAPSTSAEDVLIPGIESCRSCHGGARAQPPRVASDCVLCHPFHREELGPMRSVGSSLVRRSH